MLALSLVALIASSLFTGAAAYITFVEHPARLPLDDASLLAQWKPSYGRALPLQSGLAIIGGLSGIASWYLTGEWLWLAGSAVLLLNWPYTLIGIMPTNNRLKAITAAEAGAESRSLLLKWGKLHNLRSALGAIATVLFAASIIATH